MDTHNICQTCMAYHSEPNCATDPITFVWWGKGYHIFVAGSWNDWNISLRLTEYHLKSDFKGNLVNNKIHVSEKTLPVGTYQFKFIVDNQWKHSNEYDSVEDGHGGFNNTI